MPRSLSKIRCEWMIECAVIMALAWLAPMVYAIFSPGMMHAPDLWVPITEADDGLFLRTQAPALAASLQVLLPLLYIVWRSDASWADVGIAKLGLRGLLLLGPLLGVASLGAEWLLVQWLNPPPPTIDWFLPVSTAMWVFCVMSILANSLAEELVWRGFMLHRLKQLSGSPTFALIVSTVLFASYHIYQGPSSAGLAMVSGAMWGVSVLVTRRVWPAVVGHAVHNVVMYSPLGELFFSTDGMA